MFTGGFHARQVEFKTSDGVLAALDEIARTEDLHLSPNGKRLAIAGLARDRLLILDIEVKMSGKDRVILARDHLQISSPHLNHPHGVCWADDSRLIAANRDGDVGLFAVPKRRPVSRRVVLNPVTEITAKDFSGLSTPGSVSVHRRGKGMAEVLLCNNYIHTISQHRLHLGKQPRFDRHKTLLAGGFDVPDGVSHAPSGKLFAVSDHNNKAVNIFSSTKKLHLGSKPMATLGGISYPHGVRFSRDTRYLFVADAGEPFVHIFQRGGNIWRNQKGPAASLHVMSTEEYLGDHENMEEGGPKGVLLWEKHGLLAVTCSSRPLAFFDVASVLKAKGKLPASMRRSGIAPPPPVQVAPPPAEPQPVTIAPPPGLWQRLRQLFA